GGKTPQTRRRGKSGEAGANNGEIHLIRKSARGWSEVNTPGRRAPRMSFASRGIARDFAAHGTSLMQTECGAWRTFARALETRLRAQLINPLASKHGRRERR